MSELIDDNSTILADDCYYTDAVLDDLINSNKALF